MRANAYPHILVIVAGALMVVGRRSWDSLPVSAILSVVYTSMPTSNVGDFGWELQLAVNQNLSTTVNPPSGGNPYPIGLTVSPPNGGEDFYLAFTAGASVWATPSGLFAAGFWVERTVDVADFPLAGAYTCQLIANPSSQEQLSSSPFSITIGARI